MKISAYTAAYSPTLQPMHLGAISLDMQTQELETLLFTILHLPPRCGIQGHLASCTAHIFKTLYLAARTLQFQIWKENTHRAYNTHN